MGASPIRGRALTAIVVGVAGVAAVVAVATAAFTAHVARVVIVPPRKRVEDIGVLACSEATLTLTVTAESVTPGRYGFTFGGGVGYARMGDIIDRSANSVTRELLGVEAGDLAAARRGRFAGGFYRHPRELDVPVEDVEIGTPVGPAPAWLVRTVRPSTRWAVLVHGRGVTRAEPIRSVPAFSAAGYNSLLVSYRNDGDAPASDDGRYALGATEWRDVEAAISFAVEHGATDIVLMGWSMGGATSLQAALLSSHRQLLRGLALESPVVDWRSVLDFQAKQQRVPWFVRLGALELLSNAWGGRVTGQSQPIDLDSLDLVDRAGELTLPILIMHSAADAYVPVGASRQLALARPDLVRYEEFDDALHAKLWNRDPARFDAVLTSWLASLREPTARTGRSTRRAATASG